MKSRGQIQILVPTVAVHGDSSEGLSCARDGHQDKVTVLLAPWVLVDELLQEEKESTVRNIFLGDDMKHKYAYDNQKKEFI